MRKNLLRELFFLNLRFESVWQSMLTLKFTVLQLANQMSMFCFYQPVLMLSSSSPSKHLDPVPEIIETAGHLVQLPKLTRSQISPCGGLVYKTHHKGEFLPIFAKFCEKD